MSNAATQSAIEFKVVAKRAEDRVVYGWAYVCKRGGEQVVDHSGDFILPEDLERAQWKFVKDARAGGEMHEGDADARLVASLVFTDDVVKALALPDETNRGWFVGFEVPEGTFAKVKDGSLLMFSIEGQARAKEVA